MLKRVTLAALGASLLAGSALAAQAEPQDGPRGPRHDPLAMADQNKDGIVTRDEMLAGVATRFNAMDANHDGKVTPEEREAYMTQQRARMGARMAPKKDLTLADEQARAARMFDRIDTNHDGKIDAAERQAAAQKMMQMRRGGGWRGRQGPPAGDMPPPPPADGN
ncbi:ca2+ sensor protein [Sphingomonas sp. ABOLD]|uniref:Spy/CpxP family protein refolding chaperone n=1 Tax=Sphingomonas trueperi TaxID=53317 RepID=A0A7X5Y204_9SPHN|nr:MULTISPECIES: EF-hand domain-containing protein [Sphingomonas]NJB99639.1 Spy/CpxP family protein refolding chaperone [Sphingomonas trueperi]RSV37398.1 ca2+ sensor protein [Sphingomonas sp. ABOLE]RSV50641.1 ca2+ sensor protein [Sphingomonas sp. ABOLD]